MHSENVVDESFSGVLPVLGLTARFVLGCWWRPAMVMGLQDANAVIFSFSVHPAICAVDEYQSKVCLGHDQSSWEISILWLLVEACLSMVAAECFGWLCGRW